MKLLIQLKVRNEKVSNLNRKYSLIFLLTLLLCLISTVFTNETPSLSQEQQALQKEQMKENLKKINKVLFMVKLPEKLNSSDPLNFVNYKNMIITNKQISFFESNKNNVAEKDTNPSITDYIYTLNTEDIELPCLNRSFVCLYEEILGEYLKIFPEIDFAVPQEIIQYFGERNKVMKKCIVLTNGPAINLKSANWICHKDEVYLKHIQTIISKKVRETVKGEVMELFVKYISPQGTAKDGLLKLENDYIKFIDLNQKIELEKKYLDLELGAVSLYLKENLPETLKNIIDDGSRCFKLTQKEPKLNYYFCVLYSKTDQSMQKKLTIIESRWYSLFYADYFTTKSEITYSRWSLTQFSKSSNSLEIDHSQLASIKNLVRKQYLIERHKVVQKLNSKEITLQEAGQMLKEIKSKIIESTCNGVEVCIKALNYCIDKGLLVLSGSKGKYSMDSQNPYSEMMPSMRLAIDGASGGVGAQIVNQAASKKGSQNYWAEHLPAAAKGETPNMTNIKQAYNTVSGLKDSKRYKRMDDFAANCKQSHKNASSNIKRKIAFLTVVDGIDPFLKYLGIIHDNTLVKSA